jgi:hypothetical protein
VRDGLVIVVCYFRLNIDCADDRGSGDAESSRLKYAWIGQDFERGPDNQGPAHLKK